MKIFEDRTDRRNMTEQNCGKSITVAAKIAKVSSASE